jgi:hypothetical protein
MKRTTSNVFSFHTNRVFWFYYRNKTGNFMNVEFHMVFLIFYPVTDNCSKIPYDLKSFFFFALFCFILGGNVKCQKVRTGN